MRLLVLSFLFVLYFSSCEKGSSEDHSFGTCNADGIFEDSLATSKLLVGTWKWTKSACGFCGKPGIYKADKAVIANFKADNTFSVTVDTETITEGAWKIKKFDENNFYFSLTPSSLYLDGSISVCATELKSDATPWDGGAYLFVRAN